MVRGEWRTAVYGEEGEHCLPDLSSPLHSSDLAVKVVSGTFPMPAWNGRAIQSEFRP